MKTVTGGTSPYTSTMSINDGEPCVQRDCATETVCCDRANLRALAEGSMLAHVMGHNFAPFSFQKPRLGLLTEQTALDTFWGASARSRPFGSDQCVTETNAIGVRVFIRRNAAAYGDEVSAPPKPVSYGF